jgi:uncharacterized membrane protein HdeD (DUF308 family)
MDRTRILDRLVYAALLGVSSIAVIEFLQFPKLDTALTISLICFAVAMPLLAMGIFIIALTNQYQAQREPLWFGTLELLGVLAAFFGLGAMLWHLHWIAATLFCAATLVAVLACLYYAYLVASAKRN